MSIADLRINVAPSAWMADAACVGVDPELFFPGGGFDGLEAIDAAKRICHACPVQQQCLSKAMNDERGKGLLDRHGILGAFTPSERVAYDRHRTKAARRKELLTRGDKCPVCDAAIVRRDNEDRGDFLQRATCSAKCGQRLRRMHEKDPVRLTRYLIQ